MSHPLLRHLVAKLKELLSFRRLKKTSNGGRTVPLHVAIIMDGNGRWARKRGLPRIAGHRRGMEVVRNLVRLCGENGVKYLTLFAFSSENWRRPAREVQLLMDLFASALENEVKKLHDNDVKLYVIGDLGRFGERITSLIKDAESLTRNNQTLTLTIAANYGGRWDIAQACRKIVNQVQSGALNDRAITEETVENFLCASFLPEPDLFIRTGGEQRLSNYLLWQLAYAELYFTDVLWPDFNEDKFLSALQEFSKRQRRFGQTGEQIDQATNA
ncbi:MAG TPA: isoprenyl transferase [Acidiferrobacteraceae bacterium]|nr:isoprenyl transferase [Acidiferrobacteraceae bacterium]